MFLPLPTDALVWLLITAAAGFAWYCARRPHLATPWARVFRSRAAVASAVFLAAYLLVGFLDSLHYRPALPSKEGEPKVYSVQALSVLDLILTPLRSRTERTYSAPLATRLYQKEQVEQPGGKSMRDFPRLRHGGAHLKEESDWGKDVTLRSLAGLAGVAVLWLAMVLLTRRALARRWPHVPWGAAYGALAALLAAAGPAVALSTGYHVLGTDRIGQDILYQALKSVRTSLVICRGR